MNAQDSLREAADLIGTRGEERDNEGERSMAKTVKAFNAMFDKDLTEVEGWQFMTLLKMSRANGGSFKADDYVDGAAYVALAGEAASNTPIGDKLYSAIDQGEFKPKNIDGSNFTKCSEEPASKEGFYDCGHFYSK